MLTEVSAQGERGRPNLMNGMGSARATRSISAAQFALAIAAGYLALGMFHFPRELVIDAGPEALWAFLLDCGAALVGLWLWFRVNRLTPDEPVGASVHRYLTPVAGYPLNAVTVVVHLALAVLVLANFSWVMVTFFLPNTPAWAIATAILATALYMAWFDTPVLGRVLQSSFVPAVILSVSFGLLLLGKITDAYALVPVLPLHVSPILQAAYHSSYIFWGYEITLTLYPFVREGHRRQAERYAYAMMGLTFLFYLFGYFLTVGVEGPDLMRQLIFPPVSVMRLVDVTAFVINKLGLLIVVFWGLFVLSFESLRIWCVVHDIMALTHLKTMTQYRALALVLGVLVLILSTQFPNVDAVVFFGQAYMVPTMLLYNFGVPPLLLLVAVLRRRVWRRVVATP